MDVHIDHSRENKLVVNVNDQRRIWLQGPVGQGLNLATVDDDVPFEESSRSVNSTVSDDEINSQNRSPIHPALIRTYIFLILQDGFIR